MINVDNAINALNNFRDYLIKRRKTSLEDNELFFLDNAELIIAESLIKDLGNYSCNKLGKILIAATAEDSKNYVTNSCTCPINNSSSYYKNTTY